MTHCDEYLVSIGCCFFLRSQRQSIAMSTVIRQGRPDLAKVGWSTSYVALAPWVTPLQISAQSALIFWYEAQFHEVA